MYVGRRFDIEKRATRANWDILWSIIPVETQKFASRGMVYTKISVYGAGNVLSEGADAGAYR